MPQVTVALIDSGVARLPGLEPWVLPGWSADGGIGDGDGCGHGTLMAQSILAAAPDVRLVPLKLLDSDGGLADPARVADAFAWIVEHRARLGIQLVCATLADWGHYRSDSEFRDTPLARSVLQLRALGVATVMPAGNAYRLHRKWGLQGMAWPAILREVISVGEWTQGRIASSSQHLHASEGTGCATTVFAEALPPSGTSGACARVTAALARQLTACATLGVDALLQRAICQAPDALWPRLSLQQVQ